MALLSDVKTSLGISHNALDSEINETILAAKSSLRQGGVKIVDELDPYTAQAIKLYCKASFNFQGRADEFRRNFERVRTQMALSGDYRGIEE